MPAFAACQAASEPAMPPPVQKSLWVLELFAQKLVVLPMTRVLEVPASQKPSALRSPCGVSTYEQLQELH